MIRLKQLLSEGSTISYPTGKSRPIWGNSATPVYYNYVDQKTKKRYTNSNIHVDIYIMDDNNSGFSINNIKVNANEGKSGLRFLGLNEGSTINIEPTIIEKQKRTTTAMNQKQVDVVYHGDLYGKETYTYQLRLDFDIVNIQNFINTLSSDNVWGTCTFNIDALSPGVRPGGYTELTGGMGPVTINLKGNPERPIYSSQKLPSISQRGGGTVTP